MVVKKYKYFTLILVFQFGLQIKYSFVKSALQEIANTKLFFLAYVEAAIRSSCFTRKMSRMNFFFLCGLLTHILTKISAAFLLDDRWYKISKEEISVFLAVKRLKHSLNQCSIIRSGFAIGNLLDSDSKILFGRMVLKDLKYNTPFSNSNWVQAVDS